MTSTDEEHARSEALLAAISTVLQEHANHTSDRGLVTRFVLVAEQVGDDGDPWLRIISEPDSVQWHRMGLLEYALAVQRGVIARDDTD